MVEWWGASGTRRTAFLALVACTLLAQAADAHPEAAVDVRSVGLPWYWLAVGFGAQALFMSRFAVQWWASERMQSSVVPVAFWWLSLAGGGILLVYFIRRGDPVGVAGQMFGCVVYLRNLILIHREPGPGEPGPGEPGSGEPA